MNRLSYLNFFSVCFIVGLCHSILIPEIYAQAQLKQPHVKEHIVGIKTFFSTDKLPAGKEVLLMVQLEVKQGWHVYANPANPDYLYPVKLVVSSKGKIESTKILYPKGSDFVDPQSNEAYKVYEDKVDIIAQIKAPKELAGMEEELTITLDYQACDSVKCLAPAKNNQVFKVRVASETEEVKAINQDYFAKKSPK